MAIGGGEIGRPDYPVETTEIDQEIIRISGKKHPKLLFIPTATSDSESYYEVIAEHFGKRLGCQTDVIYLIRDKPSTREIEEKILGSEVGLDFDDVCCVVRDVYDFGASMLTLTSEKHPLLFFSFRRPTMSDDPPSIHRPALKETIP